MLRVRESRRFKVLRWQHDARKEVDRVFDSSVT